MCPLLLKDGWGHTAVVLRCPLFFGARLPLLPRPSGVASLTTA
jgi:hypothetical protein